MRQVSSSHGDRFHNPLARQRGGHLSERHMRRHQDHSQPAAHQHHANLSGTGKGGEQLGVARVGVASRMPHRLADRCRDQALERVVQSQTRAGFDITIRCLSACGRRPTGLPRIRRKLREHKHGQHVGLGRVRITGLPGHQYERRPKTDGGLSQGGRVPQHHQTAGTGRGEGGLEHNLRADPGWIAHGHTNQRKHDSSSLVVPHSRSWFDRLTMNGV